MILHQCTLSYSNGLVSLWGTEKTTRDICFYFVLYSVELVKVSVLQQGNFKNVSLLLKPCGKSGTTSIVHSPLYHATIISRDYKVSLEKLGRNNLVHCPRKLELPFLPFPSFSPHWIICSVLICARKNTPLIRQTIWLTWKDFILSHFA